MTGRALAQPTVAPKAAPEPSTGKSGGLLDRSARQWSPRAAAHAPLFGGSCLTRPAVAAAGAGQPLDPATRRFFEPRFEHDFSGVRLHPDRQAAAAAGAAAYALGSNIVWGGSTPDVGDPSDRRLLAHELAHVVQQSRGGTNATDPSAAALEADADRAGRAALDGRRAVVAERSGVRVARQSTGGGRPPVAARYNVTETALPNGRVRIRVWGTIGDAIERPGLEAKYPLPKDVGLPGYDRWHLAGPDAVGAEAGIAYAPKNFNVSKTAEVEGKVRRTRAAVREQGGEGFFDFTADCRIAGEHEGVQIRVLESVNWKVDARLAGSDRMISIVDETASPAPLPPPPAARAPHGAADEGLPARTAPAPKPPTVEPPARPPSAGMNTPPPTNANPGATLAETALEGAGHGVPKTGGRVGALAGEDAAAGAARAGRLGRIGTLALEGAVNVAVEIAFLAAFVIWELVVQPYIEKKFGKIIADAEARHRAKLREKINQSFDKYQADRIKRIVRACHLDQLKALEKAGKTAYVVVWMDVVYQDTSNRTQILSRTLPESVFKMEFHKIEFGDASLSEKQVEPSAAKPVDTNDNSFLGGNPLWSQRVTFSFKAPPSADLEKELAKEREGKEGPPESCLGAHACFIATACYGSAMADEVAALRRFRDHRLLGHMAGRAFVRTYYALSPPVARWLTRHAAPRRLVRDGLVGPLVRLVVRRGWDGPAVRAEMARLATTDRAIGSRTSESTPDAPPVTLRLSSRTNPSVVGGAIAGAVQRGIGP